MSSVTLMPRRLCDMPPPIMRVNEPLCEPESAVPSFVVWRYARSTMPYSCTAGLCKRGAGQCCTHRQKQRLFHAVCLLSNFGCNNSRFWRRGHLALTSKTPRCTFFATPQAGLLNASGEFQTVHLGMVKRSCRDKLTTFQAKKEDPKVLFLLACPMLPSGQRSHIRSCDARRYRSCFRHPDADRRHRRKCAWTERIWPQPHRWCTSCQSTRFWCRESDPPPSRRHRR